MKIVILGAAMILGIVATGRPTDEALEVATPNGGTQAIRAARTTSEEGQTAHVWGAMIVDHQAEVMSAGGMIEARIGVAVGVSAGVMRVAVTAAGVMSVVIVIGTIAAVVISAVAMSEARIGVAAGLLASVMSVAAMTAAAIAVSTASAMIGAHRRGAMTVFVPPSPLEAALERALAGDMGVGDLTTDDRAKSAALIAMIAVVVVALVPRAMLNVLASSPERRDRRCHGISISTSCHEGYVPNCVGCLQKRPKSLVDTC